MKRKWLFQKIAHTFTLNCMCLRLCIAGSVAVTIRSLLPFLALSLSISLVSLFLFLSQPKTEKANEKNRSEVNCSEI